MGPSPHADNVPAQVNRYLLPHERQVITVHQHPAVLIKPIAFLLAGLALAAWLSLDVAHGNGDVIVGILVSVSGWPQEGARARKRG